MKKPPSPAMPPVWSSTEGMELRDYFAGAALTGILTNSSGVNLGYATERAYHFADAMLEARAKSKGL